MSPNHSKGAGFDGIKIDGADFFFICTKMADSLHNTLASFRDVVLQSIARLEFQLRDSAATTVVQPQPSTEIYNRVVALEQFVKTDQKGFSELYMKQGTEHNHAIRALISRIESLEMKLSTIQTKQSSESVEEILTIEQKPTTRNIVVTSVRSTPALSAIIADVNLEPVVLDSESESDVERCEMSESDCTGEVIEDEEETDSGPELTKVIIKGVSYYMDSSNTVYQETEDGYEEVGVYNPKFDRIDIVEEEEVEEEDEEAIETEEFVYKGQTYQRDTEGNVYDDEGDVIGHWNGKKIVAAA